ncbi:FG-GAP repeat domain-containing protein [Streptomyces sp. NPDC059567]|uniref:FG-GAP repeat domain-containing protein n=1 Tax=Streptomyces sp. NPDC059567 TaxID=3346867 RepID=UPI0036C734CD
MRLLAGVGDLTADGRPDVLAVDKDGKLWLYEGDGDGLGDRHQVSTGWGIVQTMTGVGDLTGDGLPDLMAVWNDGTAHLYPGKDRGLGARNAVNLGWSPS